MRQTFSAKCNAAKTWKRASSMYEFEYEECQVQGPWHGPLRILGWPSDRSITVSNDIIGNNLICDWTGRVCIVFYDIVDNPAKTQTRTCSVFCFRYWHMRIAQGLAGALYSESRYWTLSPSAKAQFSEFTSDTCAGLAEALSTDSCLLLRMRSFLLSLLTHAQVWLEPCAQCRGDGSRPRGAPAHRVRGGSQVSFFRRKKILSFLLCSELVN